MAGREDHRIFIGGLSRFTTQRILEDAFSRYGRIIQSLVMADKVTGQPRGYGFISFGSRRAMEDSIREMNGRELNGLVITVRKAHDRNSGGYMEERLVGHRGGGGGSYSDSYRGGGDRHGSGSSSISIDCSKCGRHGHNSSQCSYAGGGGSGGDRHRYDSYSDRGDRFEDQSRDRYVDREDLGFGLGLGLGGGGSGSGSGDGYRSGGRQEDRHERGNRYRERPGPYDRSGRVGGDRDREWNMRDREWDRDRDKNRDRPAPYYDR
ncbi:glycine-rich RNA-binding protein 7-like [Impatiens glandulifera]|uniref:glycine-rich RNA-binding protein 7-like n=1 Tax=Impatiens glandulifera TaxID=253017 RepID=UPI001FB0EEE1|nr:glycine-rich RNA-binding protein 7-like [Impatiens glandulifera]